jgi:hypothetical protein
MSSLFYLILRLLIYNLILMYLKFKIILFSLFLISNFLTKNVLSKSSIVVIEKSIMVDNNQLINPTDIIKIKYHKKEATDYILIKKKKTIIKHLNKASLDAKMNDGRMLKIAENDIYIRVIYKDKSEKSFQLWESGLMKFNEKWYHVDYKKISNCL